MALINNVLEGCDGFAIAYMDDILIYSPDEKTHLKHFEIIFKKLKKAKLKIKISKCSFLKKHLSYVGTIDGPEVSYVAVGDHPSDIILLEEENLYNQIWSHWNYEQVLLQNSSPAGNASPSGIPEQPEEQHQCPGCSSPPPGTPPVELLQLPQGASSSGPLSAQQQQPQPGTSGQAAIPYGPHPKPVPETSRQIVTQQMCKSLHSYQNAEDHGRQPSAEERIIK